MSIKYTHLRHIKALDQTPQVAILVSTTGNWGRQIVRGIFSYANEVGPWHILVTSSEQAALKGLPRDWRGDGVIANVTTSELGQKLSQTGQLVVNVADITLDDFSAPCFRTDDRIGAKIAADHFVERGLRNFGFVGPKERSNPSWYARAFEATLKDRELDCSEFWMKPDDTGVNNALISWLRKLPKPVGLMVWGHGYARKVVDSCLFAGISVPHDVAVLGGSYDELMSHACFPSLSGLIAPTEQIGYQAAKALHRMMKGEKVANETTYIPPRGVVERPSTDTLAVDDKRLVQVVEFLRLNALGSITVEDILKAVPMARRSLERRFQHAFGRTPADEIRRIRINHARKLLAETNLPMQDIAEACGYATYNYLTAVFKKTTGHTPRDYRKQYRH